MPLVGRLLALGGALLSTGCDKTEISVYRVPKSDPWKLPPGWQEREAGGMRSARFTAPSTGDSELDVSIFPIRGFSGDMAQILNIWRQQLKLEPLADEAEGSKSAQKTRIGTVDAELYDLSSTEEMSDGRKIRSLIAATRKDGTMWFVKMTGDAASVEQQKANFLEFIKGMNLNFVAPPAAPSMERQASRGGEPSEEHAHDHSSHPEWEVPAGWTEHPPSQFLNAKFIVTGAGGAKVDVNVSVSPGDGGGLSENINRWRGQVGLEAWEVGVLEKNVSTFDAIGAKATLVDFKGTDSRTGRPARIIGVIVPLPGRTWFYKMMGDEQVADREKPALIKFVSTAKHPNG
jgi:hypothetical protein